MSEHSPSDSAGFGARDHRARELRRRIEELEAHDESSFGHFTRWDWTLCVLIALVLPVLAVWWFAP